MLEYSEVVVAVLGLGLLLLAWLYRKAVTRLPHFRLFAFSYLLLLASWLLTLAEGFGLQNFFNLLEHIAYTASTLLLVIWVWRICRTGNWGNRL